jgi:hypothetical protein
MFFPGRVFLFAELSEGTVNVKLSAKTEVDSGGAVGLGFILGAAVRRDFSTDGK